MTLATRFSPKKYRKEIFVGRLYSQIRTLEERFKQREEMIHKQAAVIREMEVNELEKDSHPFKTFFRRLRIRWLGRKR